MKMVIALLPAPLVAAVTPTDIAAGIVAVCLLAFAITELMAEGRRKRRIEKSVQRFFERRERNRRSIRL